MKADVNFDEHVERASGALHRVRPAAHDERMVHDDRDRRAIHQREQPRRVRRVHRIGQPDVGDAGANENLGLADLRATDAGRTGANLPTRDDRRLVGLGVGAESNARDGRERLHPRDVVHRTGMVDQNLGCGQVGQKEEFCHRVIWLSGHWIG